MTLFSLMTLNNPRQHGFAHLSVQRGHSPECRCMHTKAFLASPGRCPIDTLTSHAWKSPSPPRPQPASPWPSHLRKWQLGPAGCSSQHCSGILDSVHSFTLHSSYQQILLALRWKYARNPGTCHHLLCYHPGPSGHHLVWIIDTDTAGFPAFPLAAPTLQSVRNSCRVTVKSAIWCRQPKAGAPWQPRGVGWGRR